jgi:hypothetical protein
VVYFMLWPLFSLEKKKKIAVPSEQEIGLAKDTVWTLWRRKSVLSLSAV